MAKKKKYGYKPGRGTPKVSAQQLGKELERIVAKHDGRATPAVIVEESKPKAAVLHGEFEWQDRRAAALYREYQARNLVNVLTVIHEDTTGKEMEPVQAIVSVQEGKGQSSYQPIEAVFADPDKKQQHIDKCLRRLIAIRAEFRALQEFGAIWQEIDRLAESL